MAGIVRASLYFDVNGRQAVQQVQQVEKSVAQLQKSTNSGFGQTQQVAQQAVYAIDDFFAAFATGGVAGGLRGAGNNLTLIASQLGGIKTQLIAIGVLAAGQLLAKYFLDAKEATKASSRELDEYRAKLEHISGIPGRQRELNERTRDITDETSVSALTKLQLSGQRRLADLQEQMAAERRHIGNLKTLRSTLIDQEAVEAVKDQIAQRTKALQVLQDEVREQRKLNSAIEAQIPIAEELARNNIAPGIPGDRFGFFSGGAGAELLQAKLKAGKVSAAFDPFKFFDKFPGANSFGSAGAVSAINQAQFGPKNVQDSQLRELQGIHRSVSDVSRTLGSKLPIAVEVRL